MSATRPAASSASRGKGWPSDDERLIVDRRAHLLQWLNPSMRLIEIGPSHMPLAPKRDGWRTMVVDHAPRPELVKKYADHQVDLASIEEVDILWSGGDLAAKFPAEQIGRFDAILASHVLEHMPDPIAFLVAAQRLLQPGGLIILALPDKRYMFDYFQPMTTTADWLTAHETGATTHSKRAAFNHVAYSITHAGQITWNHERPLDELRFAHHLHDGDNHFKANTDGGHGGHYHDYHAWHFTPSSFMLLILETCLLRDIDFRVAQCTPACGFEFFVVLARGRPPMQDAEALNSQRLGLLKASIHELRQATDLMLGVI